MVRKTAARTKPHILVVGGEARNLGSKKLKELFEITQVDKNHKTMPKMAGEHFDAMVVLRFISPDLIKRAKAWADERKVPRVEVRSIGQCPVYLSQVSPSIKQYLEGLEGVVEEEAEATPVEVETPPPTPSSQLSDDDLWDSYGEKFVSDLNGLTKPGEIYTEETFKKEVIEFLTSLSDSEMVDRLFRMLIPRGIVTLVEGKIVVGTVEAIDYEKMKKFIAEPKAPPKEIEVSRTDEDQPEDEAEDNRGNQDEDKNPISEARMEFLARVFGSIADGSVYQDTSILFHDLHRAGLHHPDGRPLSTAMMRNYLKYAEDAGIVKRVPTGNRYAFRIRLAPPATPDTMPVPVHEPIVTAPPAPVPVPAPVQVPVLVPTPPPAPPPPPHASIAPSVDTSKLDLTDEEAVFDAIESTFSGKSWPSIMSCADAARVLKSAMYEQFWDEGACRAILTRLRLPANRANIDLILKIKNAFIDEQWTYLAMGYFKDRTVSELLAVLRPADKFWRTCQDCEQDFVFYMPRRCRDCNIKYRETISQAKDEKGGS